VAASNLGKPAKLHETSRLLKNDAAHGLTVSPPNRDRLTMRVKPLKTLDLILSLSKDEAGISAPSRPFEMLLAASQESRGGAQHFKLS
jgi:hypothetical protein